MGVFEQIRNSADAITSRTYPRAVNGKSCFAMAKFGPIGLARKEYWSSGLRRLFFTHPDSAPWGEDPSLPGRRVVCPVFREFEFETLRLKKTVRFKRTFENSSFGKGSGGEVMVRAPYQAFFIAFSLRYLVFTTPSISQKAGFARLSRRNAISSLGHHAFPRTLWDLSA